MVDQGSYKEQYMSDNSQQFELHGKKAKMNKPLQNNDNDYLSNFITQMYHTTNQNEDIFTRKNHMDLDSKPKTLEDSDAHQGDETILDQKQLDLDTPEDRKTDALDENSMVRKQ